MKRFFAVILSILMVGTFLTGCMSEEKIKDEISAVERYQYPIDITSENWFQYSVAEKSEMLRIPQETLDGMSDLQLLFAAADYPYFCDVSVYGFDKAGFETYAKYCSAFEELLSRKSFVKSLQVYGEAITREYLSDLSDSMAVARADFMLNVMEVYAGSRPDLSDLMKDLAQLTTEATAPTQITTAEATQPVKNWIPQDPDPIEYEENHVQATLAYFGGLLYVHDNREDTIGTELPDGYFYIGSIAAEDSNSIPKSCLRSCHIPVNTDLYASTNNPDYIYYRQDADGVTTYRRMIRAALVENYWSDEKINDALPEDYLEIFFLDLMKGTPYFNLYGTATGTEFAAPEDIDLHTFFYNGFADLKQGILPLTDEEMSYLLANGWGGDKPISNAQRYPVERMDELLRKYLGIGFEDTNKIGLDRMDNYRQQNECYYRWLSDFFGVVPRIVSVEADGDSYKVTYYRSEYDDCQYVMTLEREGHTLMIRSNMKAVYEEYISTVPKGEYRFVDLDGDGERELFIQWKKEKCEIATISNGNVVSVLSSWNLFLCEGGIVGRFVEIDGGAVVCYHKIVNGEAVIFDVVVWKSHDGSFYRGTDPDEHNKPRITKEEAHKIAEQYALLEDSIPYYLTWLYS